jgi:hypothetical protein
VPQYHMFLNSFVVASVMLPQKKSSVGHNQFPHAIFLSYSGRAACATLGHAKGNTAAGLASSASAIASAAALRLAASGSQSWIALGASVKAAVGVGGEQLRRMSGR